MQKSNSSAKPRCLTIAGKKILWSHLFQAYNFDQSQTSIHIHEKLTENFLFVCFDLRLTDAARMNGLEIFPSNDGSTGQPSRGKTIP